MKIPVLCLGLLLGLLWNVGGDLAAQNRYHDVWYFGEGLGIDFRSGTATPINGPLNTFEGSAAISDPQTGNLLFFTDGMTVWDSSLQTMPNGSGLEGNSTSSQSALIIPFPGDPNLFYIFTAGAYSGNLQDNSNPGIRYSIVDIRLNGGKGGVTRKNVMLLDSATEMLTAIRSCASDDCLCPAEGYWLVGQKPGSDIFYVVQITSEGISDTVVYNIGPMPNNVREDGRVARFSHDGSMLAVSRPNLQRLELLDFDPVTGKLSNYRMIKSGQDFYGIEFSPDNTKLYVSKSASSTGPCLLLQYDLSDRDITAIRNSETIIHDASTTQYSFGGQLQLGPDDKIYYSSDFGKPFVGVINSPNVGGAGCNYVHNGLQFPSGTASLGLPNCATLELQLPPLDSLRILNGNRIQICNGDSVRLTVAGAADPQWSPAKGLSCTECPNPIARPTSTTTYRVTNLTPGGCDVREDSIVVVVTNGPTLGTQREFEICNGQSVELAVNGGIEFEWTPSDGLDCVDCRTPVASPSETVTYHVSATDENGCTLYDSVTVTVRGSIKRLEQVDTTICAGDSVLLSAPGGVEYTWTPKEGLSCTDCADPVARPTTTTTYYLNLVDTAGCISIDSVTLKVVDEPEVVKLRIGRNYRAQSNVPIVVAVEVVNGPIETNVVEFEFDLTYDPKILTIDPSSIRRLMAGTLTEDWDVDVRLTERGRLRVRLYAPPGTTLSGEEINLLKFEARLFLSNVRSSELPFTVSSTSRCFVFETEPGYARLDSICGLDLRWIETTSAKYVPPTAFPNPARDQVTFTFGLGLDGPTRMEVFDVRGNSKGLIVNGVLDPGTYTVDWNLSDIPAGTYWVRLSSGDWSETGRLLIER